MDRVRLGVVGCGGMARHHMMRHFKNVPRLQFVAASDIVPANLRTVVEEYGVEGFDDVEKMMDSGLIDAVLIATPHFFHPTYAIAAMQRGLHVLSEKPVAVTAKAAGEVNAMHDQHADLVYATMYQLRAAPKWQRVKKLIADGELGQLQRVQWTATTYRSQAYYDSGGWRATWAGEGGGVLVNQAPHYLDMLCWLLGVPQRVQGHVGLGRYHDIEVDDEVTAYLEYANGATGLFYTTTGEAPTTNRLEIFGDRGRIVVCDRSPDTIEFDQMRMSAREHRRTSKERFGAPAVDRCRIETAPCDAIHREIHINFVEAILDGALLLAPGREGIHSVELANAILMSGLKQEPVDIPTDRAAFASFLQALIDA